MESRIQIFGHPAHQLLVPFPIGALTLSVVMDAFYTATNNRQHLRTARHALDFGLLTAAVAAPFGLVDLLAVPSQTRAKRIGLAHAVGNLAMIGLFTASRLIRRERETAPVARWLSGSAFALSGLTAWLGGELVVRHAIGVSNQAHHTQPKPLVPASEVPSLSKAPNPVDPNPMDEVRGPQEKPSIVDWGKRD